MHVVVTGTRYGGTDAQLKTLRDILTDAYKPTTASHGRCAGVDVQFAAICDGLTPRPKIFARPGVSAKDGNDDWVGEDPYSDVVLPNETHLKRNRLLIDGDAAAPPADVLVVVPRQSQRQTDGGTWYSYAYGLRKGTNILVIWPDGTNTKENWQTTPDGSP